MGISVGLVGLGAFGSSFAPLFKSHPLVDRIALCDRVPERVEKFATDEFFQDKFDAADAYETLDAICEADLDALVIITQHWLHTPQAIQAMEAGKHVYSAVPLITVPDGDEILEWCDRLIETVQKTGRHYMYGETTYYRAQAMYCRRRAAEGAFGDFTYAEGEYFHDVDHGLREVYARRMGSAPGIEHAEELKRRYGRVVNAPPMHYPTHATCGPISVMNAHMTRVWATAYHSRTDEPLYRGRPSNETALFEMSNGATCRICEHREIGHPGREIFRIYGTQACFEHDIWYDKQGGTKVAADEMRDPLPDEVVEAFRGWRQHSVSDPSKLSERELKDFLGGHGGSHAHLVHEFVDAIANDRRPAITAWDAVRYTAAGVTAHKSAAQGGVVLDVPDWGDAPA